MIGYQFTPQELFASKNMWKLLKDKAGTLTRIDMRMGKAKTTMNCRDAIDVFENYFNDEITRILNSNFTQLQTGSSGLNLKALTLNEKSLLVYRDISKPRVCYAFDAQWSFVKTDSGNCSALA